MSKNFEEAYVELAQSEVPDLWDRIEAGLSEKKTVTVSAQSEKKKESIVVLFRKYQTVAAALLCAVIIVPAVILMKQNGTFSVSDSESAPAPEMNAKGATYEEAAPAEEEAAPAEEEAFAEEAAPAQEMTGAAPAEEAGASFAKEESKENEMVLQDAQTDAESARSADILYNIQVQIVGEKTLDSENNQEESGAVLTAVVLQADSRGELSCGDEITVFIPIYSSVYLPVGESFELNLRKEQAKEYGYTMAAFIERLEVQ